MQYDRNDTIIYEEGFQTPSEQEYYISEEVPDDETSVLKTKNKKINTARSTVLVTQLVICVLCAVFLYVSKNYFPDIYGTVKNNITILLNDSLIVDGNNLNDYFFGK